MRRSGSTIAWVVLTAVLLAVGIATGTLTFLALRGDDDQPSSSAPQSQEGVTVAYRERLEVPGVIGVRVLRVDRLRRLPPLHEGEKPVSARGTWIVVTAAVTNHTRRDQTVSARVLEIEDDRLIYTGGGGTASSQELFLRAALHGRTLHPGETATGALAYDVPRRAKPKWLRVPHSWAVLDVDDPNVEVSYAELEP